MSNLVSAALPPEVIPKKNPSGNGFCKSSLTGSHVATAEIREAESRIIRAVKTSATRLNLALSNCSIGINQPPANKKVTRVTGQKFDERKENSVLAKLH
jgi:hypothetical protein